MRSLAVWTTTAAVALLGVANAQTARPRADAAPAPPAHGDLQTAVTAYAAYHSDVSESARRDVSATPTSSRPRSTASRATIAMS